MSLFDRRRRGEVPAFRRVLIETTGLADPAPILNALMADPAAVLHYRVGHVITTVDAVHALGQLAQHYESTKQVAIADRLVLTKTDIASPADIAAVRTRLRALNPGAPIIRAIRGAADPDVLLGTSGARGFFDAPTIESHDHRHEGNEGHRHGIASFCLARDEPMPWPRFALWLESLASLRGPDLLRVKGIVHVQDRSRPVVIHVVQHVLYPPSELQNWPDSDRRSRIVFITRSIPDAALEKSFRAAMAG